ncbi:unnamed protein product [Cylindrotheca closterium]|uniref:Uncharacterized protein n=1 Tax=Cylindrotheca closterium TaxID=2856 RepID=A0AAD2FUZ9_9STRA|nr:unnamed protein product [Cylindrotheca closterium]
MNINQVEGSIVIPLQNGKHIILPPQLRYKVNYGGWQVADGRERASFFDWAGSNNERCVYRISEEFDDDVLQLSVRQWDPYTCQGRVWNTFHFSYGPCQDVFWSRSPANVPDSVWRDWDKPMSTTFSEEQSPNDAFCTILQANLNWVEITKIENEIAYDILYQKLLHHPTITKIDIPSAEYHQETVVDFCCNLIANSDTLEAIFFQDIGSLDEHLVQKMFQSLETSLTLKSLDLRTSRYLETWGKCGPGTQRSKSKPGLPVEAILAALECFDEASQCSLRTLDFGGNPMALSSSICPFVMKLLSPGLGLERLSFRGCALTEAGLLSVAKELDNNTSLKFLDLSHNVISKPVMEQLTKSLAKNTTLRSLKLEHCSIDLDLAECLASSLPEIRRLQHLYMDGNEFTWDPLTEAKESIGAIAIVKALEMNKSLHSLKMGEHGMFARWGMACCTSPPYSTTLCKSNLEEMDACLERNKEAWEVMKQSRYQRAIVSIAKILLSKIDSRSL